MKIASPGSKDGTVQASFETFEPNAFKRALFHQLAKKMAAMAAVLYPEDVETIGGMIKRSQPLRLSHSGRYLRAWGREYDFTGKQARLVKRIVQAFRSGLPRIAYPVNLLEDHPALADGVIRYHQGRFWLEEPAESPDRLELVAFYDQNDPLNGVGREALALAWLTMHPEWTDEQIAAKCGINRTTIYKFARYKAARGMLKQGREQFREWQQT